MTVAATDITESIDHFGSQDEVSVGELISARNEVVEKYIDYCKNYDNLDDFDVEHHIAILSQVKNIDDNAGHLSHYTELVSENNIEDYIREHIENEFPEIYEYADGYHHNSWPGSYVEFDIDGAIQDKITEAEEITLSGMTFYVVDLSY